MGKVVVTRKSKAKNVIKSDHLLPPKQSVTGPRIAVVRGLCIGLSVLACRLAIDHLAPHINGYVSIILAAVIGAVFGSFVATPLLSQKYGERR